VKGTGFRPYISAKRWSGFSLGGTEFESLHSLGGFYETAVNVKVFVFVLAFVFSLVAFLFLYLLLSLVRVLKIHLGLLYALAGSRCGLGA